tara:strand:+ start:414 stop:1304 length:891 start_codon:yes stop_codon:yes gene_type:complete
LGEILRVLIVGASGFIGSDLSRSAPDDIELVGTFSSTQIDSHGFEVRRLDLLDRELDWNEELSGFDCVIIAARPAGHDRDSRSKIGKETRDVFAAMIEAVRGLPVKPHLIALHGSLSYGDCGENLVSIGDKINPIGFAESYSIGEKPIRDYCDSGGKCAVIRAPWVLGGGSWYQAMYALPDKIPILRSGSQWMSIITVEALSQFIWDCVKKERVGVLHPPLSYRCRQRDFAKLISDVSGNKITNLGWLGMLRFEPQMRDSVLASIRLDDGREYSSEEESKRVQLENYIKRIHTGFS